MDQWLLTLAKELGVPGVLSGALLWMTREYSRAKTAHENDLREMARLQLAFLKGAKEAGLLPTPSQSPQSTTQTSTTRTPE